MSRKVKKSLSRDYLPAKAAILGAARSGLATARVLQDRGVEVFISDSCEASALDFKLASNGLAHIRHEAEAHTEEVLKNDIVVLSPGIESDLPILQQARKRNIPVWSEMELGYRLSSAPFYAVTGSSGKSTTVSLLGAIMEAAGKEHIVAGNIGMAISGSAPGVGADGVVIAEVSSFQLENIDLFKPTVAAILNLAKNHLDRYASEEDYYSAKKAIARNMGTSEWLVLNACDELLLAWSLKMQDKTNIVLFGREMGDVDCVWHADATLYARTDGKVEKIVDLNRMKICGPHNFDNAAAASAIAIVAGIAPESIAQGLISFAGLAHRLEFIREVNGVKFYNDSKATTAESIACAVSSFKNNVHLICGGRDKGCNFASIKDVITEHVKKIYVIGEAADRIQSEWKGITTIKRANSLHNALVAAAEAAGAGDVVVLSPGCSSFDMFKNYEERGDVFKEIVGSLEEAGKETA